jgi:hypothetical protein
VKRLEIAFVSLFAACWLLLFLDLFGVVHLAGTRDLGFYPFYALAVALGSISGNAFVWRMRRLEPGPERRTRRALLIHLAGPPGALALLRAFAPEASQAAAPLVPVLGVLVFSVFFVVPLIMRRRGQPPGGRGDR